MHCELVSNNNYRLVFRVLRILLRSLSCEKTIAAYVSHSKTAIEVPFRLECLVNRCLGSCRIRAEFNSTLKHNISLSTSSWGNPLHHFEVF